MMENSPTDRNLEAAVRLVQKEFLQHHDLVRGFIRGLLADRAWADDVLQETFLTIMRKAADFQPGTSFPKWACAIARYKVLEARRAMQRGGMLLSEEVIEALSVTEEATQLDPRLELLEECRRVLPPTMLRAVDLRYQEDHRPTEIAHRMGWTVEAVYVALSRARRLLRECLSKSPKLRIS
ncbi:MAG: sigma-70 family RNA polymerase sigma factor [Roseibacillus sp.]|jgi:RNA polymerase sigma-70 factor (ECF subfamily)